MSDTKPIPVRLTAALIERLDRAATRIGVNRAGIIRFCAESFLDYFEAKGKAGLPADYQEILAQQDGRRKARSPIIIESGFVTEGETGPSEFVRPADPPDTRQPYFTIHQWYT